MARQFPHSRDKPQIHDAESAVDHVQEHLSHGGVLDQLGCHQCQSLNLIWAGGSTSSAGILAMTNGRLSPHRDYTISRNPGRGAGG